MEIPLTGVGPDRLQSTGWQIRSAPATPQGQGPSPLRVDISTPATAGPAFTIQPLMQTVASVQTAITQLTQQLTESRRHDLPGAPRMDLQDFVTHMGMRDRCWEARLPGWYPKACIVNMCLRRSTC